MVDDAAATVSGALVVSLDFELAWGVHDSIDKDGGYRANLVGAREAVPRILELFARYDVAATWATVGALFAESREEFEAYRPTLRPSYADPRRDAYRIVLGNSERDDPLHFAWSLVQQVAAAPRQELGSHTFSHYYCLEPGQTVEQFRADLDAAIAIAAVKGVQLRSLVLPRHQVRPDYLPAMAQAGLSVHRGNEPSVLGRPRARRHEALWVRAARLTDSYLPLTGANSVPWEATAPDRHGLVDVRESHFLRPLSMRLRALEPLRSARIFGAMRHAAKTGRIFHLWWHPHNFGRHMEANLARLATILDAYARLRDEKGFASYAMADVARIAAERYGAVADAAPARSGPGDRASAAVVGLHSWYP